MHIGVDITAIIDGSGLIWRRQGGGQRALVRRHSKRPAARLCYLYHSATAADMVMMLGVH